ncbi:3-phosphoshikimate 1-carboxyvinyltransferase [Breznakia sp. PF5-3]|uniref:3-phosphoshikimate 1-carboxyvinyltransferase n=1 Tax=unclassified Breznakia TaxID=2623764 RepID=UPI0024073DEE|nr:MULTISPECIES: 3-phosphoshikimate 1-carboxyvinyltransferase [unclassified Breznakia]MDL2276791.1 3-phosphoshikimate 1-carboxyvinyltransferase [Breznakia sp. OttesenSCG-928-G09]MDF9825275.1 3-phosphoshikimate 1-carboxyvinyltransferase [Breznakia sp. PM6-1]MDF9836135.1 3-phosphoshikimate 1-carboxyvinyltransferase [Breznakia sp. PF5-3]MDF9838178.1 3-phosphoshikimate 1-carboxyvinyltransferase [Breznakia sp. PFB2-8]MDF9860164.1 3-phosphoshikimate 1-carboxyvinyltransferase [Breznakia sp. PH5-24]
MKVSVQPSSCHGAIHIPPSKSMSHRAIICAALADGKSTISNIAYSDDIKVTIDGMRKLGATIETKQDSIVVQGIKGFNHLKTKEIFCKESGSTLRFFIPIFSLCDTPVSFTGENRLLKRPQTIYEDIFHNQGISYYQDENKIEIGGKLQPGTYELDGNVSSQFISGLLFALPLLDGDSTIHIKEPYESRSYVDLTLEMLNLYGIEATYKDSNTLQINGNQTYKSYDYTIEGDYSQAGFYAVLACINNDLDLIGITHNSKQGDKQIIDIVKAFGTDVKTINDGYRIKKMSLHPSDIDLQNCPDLGPILTILMMNTKGTSKLYNTERLRIKESDRSKSMESELKKCGVDIKASDDEIIINGNPPYACDEILSGHKDHRIVMSLVIAATIMDKPITITNAEYVNKSYPAFYDDLKTIGIITELHHE